MLESIKARALPLLFFLVCVSGLPTPAANLLRGYVSSNYQCPDSDSSISGSFPGNWQGNWRCLTVVTDSTLDYVPKGQQIESKIQFAQNDSGRVVVHWQQQDWQEIQASVINWSASVAQIDRTDYCLAPGVSRAWAARSRDRFTQIAPDRLLAQSCIDQYIDGKYAGRYRTQSILYKQETGMSACRP